MYDIIKQHEPVYGLSCTSDGVLVCTFASKI